MSDSSRTDMSIEGLESAYQHALARAKEAESLAAKYRDVLSQWRGYFRWHFASTGEISNKDELYRLTELTKTTLDRRYFQPETCSAAIWHGPGHQSKTVCRLTEPHDVHEAIVGEFNQYAAWRGDKAFTDYFDEAPNAYEDEP